MRLSMNILLSRTAEASKRENNDGVDFGGSSRDPPPRWAWDGDPDGVQDSHRRSGGSSSTADSSSAVSGSTGPPRGSTTGRRDVNRITRCRGVDRPWPRSGNHPSRAGSASTDRRRSTPPRAAHRHDAPILEFAEAADPTSDPRRRRGGDPPAAAEGTIRPPVAVTSRAAVHDDGHRAGFAVTGAPSVMKPAAASPMAVVRLGHPRLAPSDDDGGFRHHRHRHGRCPGAQRLSMGVVVAVADPEHHTLDSISGDVDPAPQWP